MLFRLHHRRYDLPFASPVRTAHGLWQARSGLIVRLEEPGGRVGFGEAAPIPWFGTETVEEAQEACRALEGPIGRERLEALPASLPCLRRAVGSALQGLVAEAPDLDPAPGWGPARTALGVAALLPAGRAALAAAPAKAERGFRVFKWKVGVGDPGDELGILDDLFAALPEGSRLRLDANGAWDRRRAERWLVRCAERPVEFVEEPIAREASGAGDLLLGLAADYPVALALDESVATEAGLDRWLEAGWPGFYVVKPSLLADPGRSLARLAARKARVVLSSALETPIGAAAALRLAFDWPGEAFALGFGVWPLFADSRHDWPASGPFIHRAQLDAFNPEAVWNALV